MIDIDPELATALRRSEFSPVLSPTNLDAQRQLYRRGVESIAADLERFPVVHSEVTIAAPNGPLVISMLAPRHATPVAGLMMMHGGGMVMGDRLTSYSAFGLVECVARLSIAVVSPEYALAPEFPYPAALDDGAATWDWITSTSPLGVAPDRWIIGGISGGGAVAAGTVLAIRDRDAPRPMGQLLICPMLDDRRDAASRRMFASTAGNGGVWPTESNDFCWDAVLGDGHADRVISEYAVPARAATLLGLPPTYVEVGSADIFCQEAFAYAGRLLSDGVATELHVWQGGSHGFEASAPEVPLSRAARAARESWLARRIGLAGRAR